MNAARLKIGAIGTAMTMAAALLAMSFGAENADARPAGKNPLSKNGLIYACYKVKGRNRGALRVVRHPRACRKLRGWHRTAWTAAFGAGGQHGVAGQHGAAGANGTAGPAGPQGAPGVQGETGQQGVAGTVEQSLIETIQAQSLQIDELTEDVTTLSGRLGDLEGTVASACTQLELVTAQTDELLVALAGLSLNGALEALGGLLETPGLSEITTLGAFECS